MISTAVRITIFNILMAYLCSPESPDGLRSAERSGCGSTYNVRSLRGRFTVTLYHTRVFLD